MKIRHSAKEEKSRTQLGMHKVRNTVSEKNKREDTDFMLNIY